MRPVVLPAPSPEAWRSLRLHELVRDYPELLPLLREGGVLAGENGAKTLGELGAEAAEHMAALIRAVAWRG